MSAKRTGGITPETESPRGDAVKLTEGHNNQNRTFWKRCYRSWQSGTTSKTEVSRRDSTQISEGFLHKNQPNHIKF